MVLITAMMFRYDWFLIECRKTKTKVITLVSHKGHRQYGEPIKPQRI